MASVVIGAVCSQTLIVLEGARVRRQVSILFESTYEIYIVPEEGHEEMQKPDILSG